jgi:tetratricopeptide (TPR) repeat protein
MKRLSLLALVVALLVVPAAHAQDGAPPTPTPQSPPVDASATEARAREYFSQAQTYQATADQKQREADAAAAQAAQLNAEAARLEQQANNLRLQGKLAEAEAAVLEAQTARAAAEDAQKKYEQALADFGAAVSASAAALQNANAALAEIGTLTSDLLSTRDQLARAQAALETQQREIDWLQNSLAAERGTTTWLLGALLLLSVSAIAGLALTVRVMTRRLKTPAPIVVEQHFAPGAAIPGDFPTAPSPNGRDGERGVVVFAPDLARQALDQIEQIIRRHDSTPITH